MVKAINLGFPRFGADRELKRAVEGYWDGRTEQTDLLATGAELRRRHWQLQQEAGITGLPGNDFSYYDHVLDLAVMLGAVPQRYRQLQGSHSSNKPAGQLDTMFAMARGTAGNGVAPLPMTKWFDTNYHYIVPELAPDQQFSLSDDKALAEYKEAQAAGFDVRPVLVGPITFLWLSRLRGSDDSAASASSANPTTNLALLSNLLPAYTELLQQLHTAGAQWVQLDEPILALDLPPAAHDAFARAYSHFNQALPQLRLFVATYFGGLGDNLAPTLNLPIDALHLDLVRAPEQLAQALDLGVPEQLTLSLGVVDGRNVWRTNLAPALDKVEQAITALGQERVWVAPSCSLLHVPIDLDRETDLDPEIRSWLAFAKQKLAELAFIVRAANEGRDAVADKLAAAAEARRSFQQSARRRNEKVRADLAALAAEDTRRTTPVDQRRELQRGNLNLPTSLPTTTIGSFPQTAELRQLRARWRRGELSTADYEAALRQEITDVIRLQEELGLDVLVHGEAERNDMVEYFAEQLEGFVFTAHGWVQSYGSRGVKPPILYGDVYRPEAMTVQWIRHAQAQTHQPVKGMLTGPVTILAWSFVRDDLSEADVCRQIALAVRAEIADLEAAGIKVIQLDEPAFREAMPLRRERQPEYIQWATECFRIATSVVAPETQIQTHMCYSEFNETMDAITALDADVILIEASRSNMELLDAFTHGYPADVGPGVYDIHSPRIPSAQEQTDLLRKAVAALPPGQVWVTPDCGLKTRRYEEVKPALANMVAAARVVREELAEG